MISLIKWAGVIRSQHKASGIRAVLQLWSIRGLRGKARAQFFSEQELYLISQTRDKYNRKAGTEVSIGLL